MAMDIKAETWWDRDEHQQFTGSSVKIFSFIRDPFIVRCTAASIAIAWANQRAATLRNDKNTPIDTLSQEVGQICSPRDMMIG